MKRLGVLAVVAVVVGCGEGRSGSLRVETPLNEGPAGAVFQLEASVAARDGQRVRVGDAVRFELSDPEVAAMRAGNQLALLRAGTVTVTAYYRDEVATATVRVLAAEVSGLTLLPDVDVLHVGDVQPFTLTASLGDGTQRDVTQSAEWTFDGSLVAAGMPGRATAVREGLGRVHVAFGGQTLDRQVVVFPAARVALHLAVPPGARAGEDVRVVLVAVYADGTVEDVSARAMWTSSNPETAELVTEAGTVTLRPLRAGFVQISAFSEGVKRSVAVEVTGVAIAALEPDAAHLDVPVGATAALGVRAVAMDETRTDVTAVASYVSANPAVCEVDAFGRVTAIAEGTSHVRISYGGMTVPVEVVVQPARLVGVVPSVQHIRLGVGQPLAVVVTGRYSNGTTVDLTATASARVGSGVTAKNLGTSWVLTGVEPGTPTVLFSAAGFEVPVTLEVSKDSYVGLTLALVGNDKNVRVVARARWTDGIESDVTEVAHFAIKGAAGAVSNLPGAHGVLTLPAQGEVVVVATAAALSAQISVAP